MRHLLRFITLLALLVGTTHTALGRSMQSILRSGDHELVYREGLKFHAAGKWEKAIRMFDVAAPYYVGTPREDSLAYMHAHSKFKSRDYTASADEFDLFRRKFPRSVFVEDAEGILALSYYNMSPGPERDQAMTSRAIVAINEFLAHYPESDKADEFRGMERELMGRLHDKEWLNAYTYYKIGRYKSAILALKNALKKFPTTRHREEIMYLVVKSSYELAHNSVPDKQTDRYLSMLDSYYSFLAEYPESKHVRETNRLAEDAKEFLEKHKDKNK